MDALIEFSFLSGWVLTAGIAVLAGLWWFPRLDEAGLSRRARQHLAVGFALLVLSALHTRLRIPSGWIESLLLGLLVLLLLSTLAGFLFVRAPGAQRLRVKRWVHVQVVLTYGLLGAALFHGVFVHGHGLLAHVFVESHP